MFTFCSIVSSDISGILSHALRPALRDSGLDFR